MDNIDRLIQLLLEMKNLDMKTDMRTLILDSINDYRLKLEEIIAKIPIEDNYSEETKRYVRMKKEELDEQYNMIISLMPLMINFLVQKRN